MTDKKFCEESYVVEPLEEFFSALSSVKRLQVVYLLKTGEKNVKELMSCMNIDQSSLSRHLNILKKAGILKVRREGTLTYYRLSDPRVIDIIQTGLKIVIKIKEEEMTKLTSLQ